jgi:hypothetical protein
MRLVQSGIEPMLFCEKCKSYVHPTEDESLDAFDDEEPPDAPKPPRPS